MSYVRRKIFYRTATVPRPLPEAWRPDPKGKLVWLQRVAHWILRRWGTQVTTIDEVARIVELPSPDSILEKIRDEIRARINFSAFRHEDLVLVVGPGEHQAIQMEFAGMGQVFLGRGPGREPEIFGIPIYVTSWIDGWVVMPRKALSQAAERERLRA